MATRNVVLTETQSALVDHLVASGRYQNASEALRAGLRLLEREVTLSLLCYHYQHPAEIEAVV